VQLRSRDGFTGRNCKGNLLRQEAELFCGARHRKKSVFSDAGIRKCAHKTGHFVQVGLVSWCSASAIKKRASSGLGFSSATVGERYQTANTLFQQSWSKAPARLCSKRKHARLRARFPLYKTDILYNSGNPSYPAGTPTARPRVTKYKVLSNWSYGFCLKRKVG
jgi:hypothetical protein